MPRPAKTPRTKKDLVVELSHSGRELSGKLMSFHQALASRFDLNPTDYRCLDLARNEPAGITPGRLAEATGLTTGAITAALDRLDRAGFVRRERDVVDRRKVVVRVLPRANEKLGPSLAGFSGAMDALHQRYTAGELAFLLNYQAAYTAVLDEQIKALSGESG